MVGGWSATSEVTEHPGQMLYTSGMHIFNVNSTESMSNWDIPALEIVATLNSTYMVL